MQEQAVKKFDGGKPVERCVDSMHVTEESSLHNLHYCSYMLGLRSSFLGLISQQPCFINQTQILLRLVQYWNNTGM